MKSKSIVLIVLVAVIIAMVGVVAYRGVSQTAIADFNDKASCQSYLKSQWCAGGVYACTDCSSKTLSYTLKLPSGGMTNIQWSADCVLGSGNTQNAHTFCQAAGSVTSHAGYWCSGGNLYYFNSAGVKEELKQTCAYGCTDVHTGGNTQVSCNAQPVTTPVTSSKVCVDATYLCTAAQLINGYYYCDIDAKEYCPNGCVNGACKAATCTNQCDTQGFTDCVGTDAYRTCNRGSDGCLQWANQQYCLNTQTCQQGSCKTAPVTPTPTPTPAPGATTCDASFTCASDYSVSYTLANCKTGTSSCGSGKKCVAGECTGTVQPTPAPVPASSLCAGISCGDYCDAQYTLNSQGACDKATGKCVYASVKTSSELCLPKPVVNETTGLTGDVVVVPQRTDDTTKSAFWTWFDKYGYYVGGGVIVVLVGIFLAIDSKERKRKRRNRK